MSKKDPENKVQYMPIGMCLGLSIGLCLGAGLEAQNRKKEDDFAKKDDEEE